MDGSVKIRENRLRRMAARQDLELRKSRRRDPRASDFDTYMLIDAATNTVVASGGDAYGLSLDDIEEWLLGEVLNSVADIVHTSTITDEEAVRRVSEIVDPWRDGATTTRRRS